MRNHARARICALARVHAVRDNETYIVLATYGESYVPSQFGHNPYKNKRMRTYARTQHERARTVREDEKYLVLNTDGE
jgi:hypothetical protein